MSLCHVYGIFPISLSRSRRLGDVLRRIAEADSARGGMCGVYFFFRFPPRIVVHFASHLLFSFSPEKKKKLIHHLRPTFSPTGLHRCEVQARRLRAPHRRSLCCEALPQGAVSHRRAVSAPKPLGDFTTFFPTPRRWRSTGANGF